MIACHRRHRASLLADKETMPVIVRDMDDNAAIIIMVDSNLQRENILPSKQTFAFKMKLDAMKQQRKLEAVLSQVGKSRFGPMSCWYSRPVPSEIRFSGTSVCRSFSLNYWIWWMKRKSQ